MTRRLSIGIVLDEHAGAPDSEVYARVLALLADSGLGDVVLVEVHPDPGGLNLDVD